SEPAIVLLSAASAGFAVPAERLLRSHVFVPGLAANRPAVFGVEGRSEPTDALVAVETRRSTWYRGDDEAAGAHETTT
ncbi:MAG: hypothetical protein ACI9YT_001658, partial [Halobacteriales archaeon]